MRFAVFRLHNVNAVPGFCCTAAVKGVNMLGFSLLVIRNITDAKSVVFQSSS